MQCIVLCIVLRHFLLCFKSEVETRPEGNLRSWAQWELLRCPVSHGARFYLVHEGHLWNFGHIGTFGDVWGCVSVSSPCSY